MFKAYSKKTVNPQRVVPGVSPQLPLVTASLCSPPMRPYGSAVAMTLKLTPPAPPDPNIVLAQN